MKRKIIGLVLFILIICGKAVGAAEAKWEVHFINTGQSDCILLKGENSTYLIDTGTSYSAKKTLSYLNSLGINEIDKIIITHYHDDHFGGLKHIIENKTVKKVMLPNHQSKYKAYLYSYLKKYPVKIESINKKFKIKEKNINLKSALAKTEDNKIENNNSVVLYGTIDGLRYVFMADAEKEREQELIKNKDFKNFDIMKIGHHGLDTSTSEELLNAINPKLAIITCNGGESPSKIVIERLQSRGIAILRTDKQGTIVTKDSRENKKTLKSLFKR